MGFCLGCHGSLAIRSSAHCVEVGPIVALRDHVVLQVLKQAAPGAEQLVLFGSQVFQVLGARGKGAVVAQEARWVHLKLVVGRASSVQLVQLQQAAAVVHKTSTVNWTAERDVDRGKKSTKRLSKSKRVRNTQEKGAQL